MRTRRLFGLLLAALIVALTAVGWLGAGPAGAGQATPKATYYICSDWAILPGYAVVAITYSSTCTSHKQYTIVPAQDNLQVCNNTPVPSPFAVIRITRSGSAPCNGTTALWTLFTAHDGTNACSGTPIPAGWSYTQISSSNGQCGTLRWYQLHPSAAGQHICSTSPYAATLVITAIGSTGLCDGLPAYTTATAYSGIQACAVTTIPAGYVVPRADQTGQCGQYYALTLITAYNNVVVCPFSPIPDHYHSAASAPVTNCEGYTLGYRLVYVP